MGPGDGVAEGFELADVVAGGAVLSMRLRWWSSPRKVRILAAVAAVPRAPFRHGLPFPVLPDSVMVPDWLVRGTALAPSLLPGLDALCYPGRTRR